MISAYLILIILIIIINNIDNTHHHFLRKSAHISSIFALRLLNVIFSAQKLRLLRKRTTVSAQSFAGGSLEGILYFLLYFKNCMKMEYSH